MFVYLTKKLQKKGQGSLPCREVMIRVSCFMVILFKGIRVYIQNEQNERYFDKKGRGQEIQRIQRKYDKKEMQ